MHCLRNKVVFMYVEREESMYILIPSLHSSAAKVAVLY